MNWPFIIRATLFGMLFFLYNVASGVVVLGTMPDTFGWLKLVASGVVAFVIGTFTFVRDPERAWNEGPAIKKVLLILLTSGLLAACGDPQLRMPLGAAAVGYAHGVEMYTTGKMIALQLRTEGKIPDASWEELKALDIRATTMRGELEKQLLNPVQPVDYEKILSYTAQTADLLIKLGVIVAK